LRTREDIRRLIDVKANVRLCKGIYIEPREVAYLDREVVRKNYVFLLEQLLAGGCYVGIATHDEWLVWEAFRVIDQLGRYRERLGLDLLVARPQLGAASAAERQAALERLALEVMPEIG
jgi:proline dehydrogenase